MFDRNRSQTRGSVEANRTNSVSQSVSGSGSGSPVVNKSRSSSSLSFFAGGGGLSRTLSTPPIAESTHIGNFSAFLNGTSHGSGQYKRKPTSPLQNNRTLFKSSGNLSGYGRINSQVLTDARSPGLVNRIVRYHDRGQQQTLNRSQSLSSVYNKPGQFPVVHLRKQELRYTGNNTLQRKGNFSMTRIAPPDKSLFQTNKRSSILRTGSSLLSTASETSSEALLVGRTGIRNGAVGGDEADAENRVITPCAELEATPTRSVLDALKEISRKRINSEELDADRIKKQCQELSELDAAGSGPPSSTAAVAIGTHGIAAKRSREQATGSSPSSPSETTTGPGLGGVARAPSSGGEQQAQKKRLCTKNNDILSSLSSSTVGLNTPKRYMVPRVERRLNLYQSPLASLSMPPSSSSLFAPVTPEKFHSRVSGNSSPLEGSDSGGSGSISSTAGAAAAAASETRTSTNNDRWEPSARASIEHTDALVLPHRVQPKITLFNRPYESTANGPTSGTKGAQRSASRVISSDEEEDEHGSVARKVHFVKPKEKSPHGSAILSGSGSVGFSSSRDPLKKPAPSKLTVMLKCLSGDLDDYEEEEEPVQPQVSRPAEGGPARNTFTFGGATVSDTVDAAKNPTPANNGPAKSSSLTMPTNVSTTVPASTAASPTVTSNGLSALINNPIKDAGLGKIGPAESSPKEPPTPASTTEVKQTEEEKKTVSKPLVEPAKQSTFTFGVANVVPAVATSSSTATTSFDFSSPLKTTISSSTAQSTTSATVSTTTTTTTTPTTTPFTFGIPAQKPTQSPTSSPLSGLAASNLISFSPAPVATGASLGSVFGSNTGKLPSPVVQFGSATTTTTTATPSALTFSFTGAASTVSTTAATSTVATTSISSPTFGAGSGFGAFKLPAALPVPATTTNAPNSSSSNSTTTTTTSTGTRMFSLQAPTTTTTSVASTATFTFGAGAAVKATPAPTTVPVFGTGSLPSGGTPNSASAPTPASSNSSFTFATPKAPSAGSMFTFGASSGGIASSSTTVATAATSSITTAPATTFPTFGALASNANSATPPTTSAPATATPVQPFVFGSPKPPSDPTTKPGNLFAAATTTPAAASTNLFAAATPTQHPGGIFGSTVTAGSAPSSTGAVTGGPPKEPASLFGGATGGVTSSPFTFGAVAKPSPAGTANNGTLSAGSIFGSASSISSQTAPSAPSSTTGLFTFGSTLSPAPGTAANGSQGSLATGSTPQQPNVAALPAVQNMPRTVGAGGSATTGSTANTTPFTFGAAAAKPPVTQNTGSIFGSMASNGSSNTAVVPTFGAAAMNGASPVPTFGSGSSIFGGAAATTNAAGNTATPGNAPPTGSIFGAQTNGPQNVTNNTVAAPSPGGMFTFGASNTTNNSTPGTFGGAGGTFGGFNTTPAGPGGLTNGIGGTANANKPFTFGATSAGSIAQATPATPVAQSPGGFNFSLGSNATKPFTFTGGMNANASGNVMASPSMFGSPAGTNPPPNASPFTFGGSTGGTNNSTGTNATPTPGPFTFGASQVGAGGAPSTGISSPFNFSAGNVAAVAPQPQQQPQQPGAFNFSAGGQQPFGVPNPGVPAFGAAPTFGAPGVGPAGVMPTFSIGTNSTPNGPPAGQRRIKVATRRVK